MKTLMYVRWDDEKQEMIDVPYNLPGDGDDWVICLMPGDPASGAQSLVWTMETYEWGRTLVGSWEGSDDPLDAPASDEHINSVWRELMQNPVAANDGRVFDFERDSREIMLGAIKALSHAGGTEQWRLYDNTTVEVDAAELQAYYDELVLNQALRGVQLNQEYVQFRAEGATLREIREWRERYAPDG